MKKKGLALDLKQTMNSILLDVLAVGAIVSSVMVITAKNPVISVLFLIAVFINAAGYLILLGITYLGLVYLIVYVGAIAILFLFVIMMLNLRLVELVDTGQEYTKSLPMGAILGSLFIFELSSFLPTFLKGTENPSSMESYVSVTSSIMNIFNKINITILNQFSISSSGAVDIGVSGINVEKVHSTFNSNITDSTISMFSQIQSIGQGLYTYASLWLIIAGIIFLLAMVGPIILCMSSTSAQPATSASLFSR